MTGPIMGYYVMLFHTTSVFLEFISTASRRKVAGLPSRKYTADYMGLLGPA